MSVVSEIGQSLQTNFAAKIDVNLMGVKTIWKWLRGWTPGALGQRVLLLPRLYAEAEPLLQTQPCLPQQSGWRLSFLLPPVWIKVLRDSAAPESWEFTSWKIWWPELQRGQLVPGESSSLCCLPHAFLLVCTPGMGWLVQSMAPGQPALPSAPLPGSLLHQSFPKGKKYSIVPPSPANLFKKTQSDCCS